jgi:hypothetical protein
LYFSRSSRATSCLIGSAAVSVGAVCGTLPACAVAAAAVATVSMLPMKIEHIARVDGIPFLLSHIVSVTDDNAHKVDSTRSQHPPRYAG